MVSSKGNETGWQTTSKEEPMNMFVVYDSQYGNTERIAQTIADTLRAFGQAQAVRVDPAHPVSFQWVDLLILGSPITKPI